MSFSQAQIEVAYTHFSGNWGEIRSSACCACSYCLKSFEADEVTKVYEEVGGIAFEHDTVRAKPTFTAVCPHCRLPYCLGDESGLPVGEPSFMQAVHQHWHKKTHAQN